MPADTTGLSGNDGDFVESLRSITAGAGTYAAKKLPAIKTTPAIPARVGESAPIVSTGVSGSSGDLVLKGAKTYASTDGLLILSFPESAETLIGSTTVTFPAIIKTP